MLLLKGHQFSVINNIGAPSFELQINFNVLQIDTENSATGICTSLSVPRTFRLVLLATHSRKENRPTTRSLFAI